LKTDCKLWVVTVKGYHNDKLTTMMKLKLDDRNLGYKIGELCQNYWVDTMDIDIKEEED